MNNWLKIKSFCSAGTSTRLGDLESVIVILYVLTPYIKSIPEGLQHLL